MLWNQSIYEWYNNNILICEGLKHFCNSYEKLINTRFNDNLSMKFYTYKKETIKNSLPHQSFQFFIRLWNLD
jgi:hypothetical protein